MNPIVSICCTAYNHVDYIKDAIEGFLMQKTDFPIEIIIHDDASTDGTTDIINEYEAKFPDLINPIYQKENQWSKGIKPSPTYVWPKAKGKYIALCEGDDYWTDPLKLQKQVDFLEANPDCIACHHWQKYAYEDNNGKFIESEAPTKNQGYLPIEKSTVREIFKNHLRIKTRTVIYRNINLEIPEWFYKVAFGDVPLSMIFGKYGKFGFINEPMAVYRQTGLGVSSHGKHSFWFVYNHYIEWIKIWELGIIHHEYKYQKEAIKTIKYFYSLILNHYKNGFNIFIKLFIYSLFNSRIKYKVRVEMSYYINKLYFDNFKFLLKKKLKPIFTKV